MGYTLFAPIPLLGRRAEVSHIDTLLTQPESRFVLVSGAVGMGKSKLLRECDSRAGRCGWMVAKGYEDEVLRVTHETNQVTFCRQLWCSLAATSTSTAVKTPNISIQVDQVLDRINAFVKVLVLIDGFHVSPEFSPWFKDVFLAALKHCRAPVLTMVADISAELTALETLADEQINLGPLDRAEVREYFLAIKELVAPPLKETEIETYVEQGSPHPDLLAGLLRLLPLAARSESVPAQECMRVKS